MDNYKIKVNDEAESKEAQELFFELGLTKEDFDDYKFPYYVASYNDGAFSNYILGSDTSGWEELTLPQLRDLVVLKRNDVKDANYTYAGNPVLKLETQDYKVWGEAKKAWLEHVGSQTDLRRGLKAIPKRHEAATGRFDENSEHHLTFSNGAEEKDPALISGADALRALADGKGVDVHESTYKNEVWFNLKDTKFTPAEILAEKVRDKPYKLSFRLKPQTIKVELEIPAPYKAKIGGRDDTSFVLNVGRHQYCYKTEENYTKARDALEAVFDSAVRGTNS
ncbi:hypothetical protein [Acinetobacter nosocomialis]|uniref:hypothetical protein n=1 Tax=Acinetobacter nosocomialis TaxID=106654 RepID=UPI00125EC278|nr:hypothetical protein [Acinetobacter nosocomialis]